MSKTFQAMFEKIQTVIPFNAEWNNGTGYFNDIVSQDTVKLENGQMAKSTDTSNRKIVMVGTRFGNVVLFERYSGGLNDVITSNVPPEVSKLFGGSSLGSKTSEEVIELLLGQTYSSIPKNIGIKIEEMFSAWERLQAFPK